MEFIQFKIQEVYNRGKMLSSSILKIMRVGQYALIGLFFFLLISLSYLYIDIVSRMKRNFSQILVWLLFGFWVMFNMVFNYIMCVLVKPGSPQNINPNLIFYIKQNCKRCRSIKPPRTHHCSMCEKCVLQMDHHCPWIGQCVGHHNRSYFMNFLFYTEIGVIIFDKIIYDYMSKEIYYLDLENRKLGAKFMMEIFIFITTLIVVLAFFNLFHWYLVFAGKTTLECCFNDPRYTPSKSWSYNLTLVFGSSNIIQILTPKFTVLQNQGFYWNKKQQIFTTSMMIQMNLNQE